jgi:hypothetical protein
VLVRVTRDRPEGLTLAQRHSQHLPGVLSPLPSPGSARGVAMPIEDPGAVLMQVDRPVVRLDLALLSATPEN